jgi:hypothetical protein
MNKRKGNHPNALKHGAFAKTTILPGEDPREFEELHSALIEEWTPVGPTEEDAVLTIARGVWRKDFMRNREGHESNNDHLLPSVGLGRAVSKRRSFLG